MIMYKTSVANKNKPTVKTFILNALTKSNPIQAQ